MALTKFDYANYEIYFALATSLDPALKVIERVKAATQRRVHIIIAGPPEDCGEKVFNLRRTVESLTENFEVIVFTDSDVRVPRGWLGKLIAPLQDPRIGAHIERLMRQGRIERDRHRQAPTQPDPVRRRRDIR